VYFIKQIILFYILFINFCFEKDFSAREELAAFGTRKDQTAEAT
jgi:hypothetical protein